MIWLTIIPADTKNIWLLGFSIRRLLLIGAVGLGLCIFAALLIFFGREKRLTNTINQLIQNEVFEKVSGLSGLFLLLIILVPLTEWGRWEAAIERIQPIITWLCLILFQWFILSKIARGNHLIQKSKNWVHHQFNGSYKFILISIVTLIFIYILSIFLYPGGIKEDYWYETGVPILGWQVIFCIGFVLIYQKFEKQIRKKLGKKSDTALFIIIFIASGILWGTSRLTPSYFNPAPVPPNNVFYPYSDAAKFDLQAQSSLLGLGFNAGRPLDRPFYPLFLAIIHLISGQDYSANMALQAFLFGVFPAIVYLICAQFGSRKWGVLTSLAITLWGVNAIQVNNILNTSTPKQMLTDFPAAIVLSLVLYVSILWLKQKSNPGIYACVVGGTLAMATFIRYSALILLPIWMIIAFIKL